MRINFVTQILRVFASYFNGLFLTLFNEDSRCWRGVRGCNNFCKRWLINASETLSTPRLADLLPTVLLQYSLWLLSRGGCGIFYGFLFFLHL